MTDTTHTLKLLKAKIEGRIKALEELRVEMDPKPIDYDAKLCLRIFTLQSVLEDFEQAINSIE